MSKHSDLQFDPNKNQTNQVKHNDIDFYEADTVLDDPYALTVDDDGDHDGEMRYFTIGMSAKNRVLIVNWTIRNDDVRIISSRLAEPRQRKQYESRCKTR